MPVLAVDHILQQVQNHPTEQLLVASRQPIEKIRAYAANNQCQLTEVLPTSDVTTKLPYQTFAVVVDYLEHLDKSSARHRLAQWRNLHCNHMWIAVAADNPDWHFDDFIALGCKRIGQFEFSFAHQGGGLDTRHLVNAFGYDLGHYNRRRDWNNPRYWANPEMWSKRW